MKRTIYRLLAALMAMGILAGCQKTPESTIVVGKNLDQLLEEAQTTDDTSSGALQSEEISNEDKSNTLVKNLGAPETLKVEIVSAKGKLHIYTNASICLPKTDKMPIARVKMSRFTNDVVERLVETLFAGTKTISDDLSLLPKGYYNNIVKDLIANKDKESWFSERYLTQEEYDESLAAEMQSFESAPTDPKYEVLQYQFDDPTNDNKTVHYYAIRGDNSLSRINVYTETGFARLEYFRNLDDSCLDILLRR